MMHKKCLNPDCNNPHQWSKKTAKTFENALCNSCRTHLSAIQFNSIGVFVNNPYDKLKTFLVEQFEAAL